MWFTTPTVEIPTITAALHSAPSPLMVADAIPHERQSLPLLIHVLILAFDGDGSQRGAPLIRRTLWFSNLLSCHHHRLATTMWSNRPS